MKYKLYVKEVKDNINELLKKGARNILITGHNMAGKTDILIEIVKKYRETAYFIDSVNRCFYKEEKEKFNLNIVEDIGEPLKINERRINKYYLNKVDTFSSGEVNTAPLYAYELFKNYYKYEVDFIEKLEVLLQHFNQNMSIEIDEEIKFKIGEEKVIPSNGYQAILRVFIEIYHNYITNDIKMFIIDEFDAHLDNSMKRILINVMSEIFPNIKIVATVHSLTIFENLIDSKIIVLDGKYLTHKIIDSSDITNFNYINKEIFLSNLNTRSKVDTKLKGIYTQLINGTKISKGQREYIDKLDKDQNIKNKDLIKEIRLRIVSMEEIYGKVFDGDNLTKEEVEFLKKEKDLTLQERELKEIILEALDYE